MEARSTRIVGLVLGSGLELRFNPNPDPDHIPNPNRVMLKATMGRGIPGRGALGGLAQSRRGVGRVGDWGALGAIGGARKLLENRGRLVSDLWQGWGRVWKGCDIGQGKGTGQG